MAIGYPYLRLSDIEITDLTIAESLTVNSAVAALSVAVTAGVSVGSTVNVTGDVLAAQISCSAGISTVLGITCGSALAALSVAVTNGLSVTSAIDADMAGIGVGTRAATLHSGGSNVIGVATVAIGSASITNASMNAWSATSTLTFKVLGGDGILRTGTIGLVS